MGLNLNLIALILIKWGKVFEGRIWKEEINTRDFIEKILMRA